MALERKDYEPIVDKQQVKENRAWSKIQQGFLSSTTALLAATSGVVTAAYQTYKGKSQSPDTIKAAFKTISDKVSDPEGKALVEQMQALTLSDAESFNTLRMVILGAPATILTSVIVLDFLKQLREALTPTSVGRVVAGGATGLGLMTLNILRATKCMSAGSELVSNGYACSHAEDPTMSMFNNILIQLAFVIGSDAALRLFNSLFDHGLRETASIVKDSVTAAPSRVVGYGQAQYRNLRIWIQEGTPEGVPNRSHSINGNSDVENPNGVVSSQPSAPRTYSRSGGATN